MYGMKPDVMEQFGLDCTLLRMLEAGDALHRIGLLSAMLAVPEVSAMPTHVFSASACREFLGVHESRGTEWFNKEHFEELGEWLVMLSLIDSASRAESAASVSSAMVKAENMLNYSRELAAHAGYRTGLYQRMLLISRHELSLECA